MNLSLKYKKLNRIIFYILIMAVALCVKGSERFLWRAQYDSNVRPTV